MRILSLFFCLLVTFSLSGCGDNSVSDAEVNQLHYDEILAAKSPYAVTKTDTPVLKTSDWERIFGGDDGQTIGYDKFGEIDELEFIAPLGTTFYLQRQLRKKLRHGETIYYQISTDDYKSADDLWIDGRFLDIREVLPEKQEPRDPLSRGEILSRLRNLNGVNYTWNGNSSKGVPELLEYYLPSAGLSERLKSDWMLEGVDSLGALYEASGGMTPLEQSRIVSFGNPVFPEINREGKTPVDIAHELISELEPLDIVTVGDHTWIVLDDDEILQSKHRSNFDGSVTITSLLDTVYGLLQKRTLVNNFADEIEGGTDKKFVIRRWYSGPDQPEASQPDYGPIPTIKSTEDVLKLRGIR